MATTIMGTITNMDIPNEVRSIRRATAYFLTRGFLFLLGIGAVAWGGYLLPLFWREAPLDRVAQDLLQGNTFQTQTLLGEMGQVEALEQYPFCSPTVLRDAVVLRLAILNDAIAARKKTLTDSAYNQLYGETRMALSCAPADSFAWLILFWLDFAKHGFEQDNATYLRLSYALGPNEGWIALRRNRIAIALFARLPDDLAGDALDEFVKLVDTGSLYLEAAAIFENAPSAVQSLLLKRLKFAKPIPRQIFAQTLYDKGFDVSIPGVDRPARPWQ